MKLRGEDVFACRCIQKRKGGEREMSLLIALQVFPKTLTVKINNFMPPSFTPFLLELLAMGPL
jgi:hypothetical protein